MAYLDQKGNRKRVLNTPHDGEEERGGERALPFKMKKADEKVPWQERREGKSSLAYRKRREKN